MVNSALDVKFYHPRAVGNREKGKGKREKGRGKRESAAVILNKRTA